MLLQKQQEFITQEQATIQKHHNDHLKDQGETSVSTYDVGTYVWLRPAESSMLSAGKLEATWKGPKLVVAQEGNCVTVRDLVTLADHSVHVSRLKPYIPSSDDVNTPFDLALKDSGLYVVQKILTHRGNSKKKSTLEFLVRWQGWSPEHDSWEPWENLRSNKRLHTYLISNNMKTLIPKRFREE